MCLFVRSLSQGSFAKETYNFKESTDRNHLIVVHVSRQWVGLMCPLLGLF